MTKSLMNKLVWGLWGRSEEHMRINNDTVGVMVSLRRQENTNSPLVPLCLSHSLDKTHISNYAFDSND